MIGLHLGQLCSPPILSTSNALPFPLQLLPSTAFHLPSSPPFDYLKSMMWKGYFIWPLLICVLASCKKDDPAVLARQFPEHIEPLLQSNCATAGCHTSQSADLAAGLNLESWEDLFKGARGGSPVVPYNADESFLIQFLNVDTSWGLVTSPTMPLGGDPYSPLQLQEIIDWINDGARNANGDEPFPLSADRRKWYVVNRGCDLVTVFDAESRQIIRMVEVGNNPYANEGPNEILFTPDRQTWMVIQYNWTVELYSSLTDERIGTIPLPEDYYNLGELSHDGRFLFVVGQLGYRILVIDLAAQQTVFGPMALTDLPSDIAVHPDEQKIYMGTWTKEELLTYDYDAAGQLSNRQAIDLHQGVTAANGNPPWANQVHFHPGGDRYFVTCVNSDEVRVFDAANDSLIAAIPVKRTPSEIAFAPSSGRIFVSCTEEQALYGNDPLKRGTIAVINAATLAVERYVYAGFQPHGLAVDEASGYLIVANRNTDPTGPSPHHVANCEGRNGNLTLIDLQSLQLVPDYKPELSVDPFRVTIK